MAKKKAVGHPAVGTKESAARSASLAWKPARGKLGPLAPLLGAWVTTSETPMGIVRVERRFARVLSDKFVELRASWAFAGSTYEEVCLFGVDAEGKVRCWSFTNDGKQSAGWLADAADLPQPNVAFEADMPAGRARQAYFPEPDGVLGFVVEARTKKGWSRFLHHHYKPL